MKPISNSYHHILRSLIFLTDIFHFKINVKQSIANCVAGYLKQQNIVYQKIELETIKLGTNNRSFDGGSFVVKVYTENGLLRLFAKKNSNINSFVLFTNKFLSRKPGHQGDHNFSLQKRVCAKGINIPKPLFVCPKNRVIITEFIDGFHLREAFHRSPLPTLKIFKQLGVQLAKLHNLNIAFHDLQPNNLFVDFNQQKIYFVDCDRLFYAKNLNSFVTDIYFLYDHIHFYFNKKTTFLLENIFLNNYLKTLSQYRAESLSVIKQLVKEAPKPALTRKIGFRYYRTVNHLLNYLTFGYFRI
jgi:tRNA A-37 threonylcarbamoyl transferase component Bud32